MDNKISKTDLQQTIKAEKTVIQQIKKIAQKEERSIQTITNRILRLGIKRYPRAKANCI